MSIVNLPGGDSAQASPDGRRRPLASLPMLVGAHTCLREVREDDGEPIVRLLSDPQVTRHQLRPPPQTRDEVDAWIRLMHRRRSEGAVLCFAITLPDAERLIGLCQLSMLDAGDDIEWGWLLEADAWGTGAFEDVARVLCAFARAQFDAPAVVAHVHKNNRRAIAALAKLGSTLRDSGDTTMTWLTRTAPDPGEESSDAEGAGVVLPPGSKTLGEYRR